MTNKIEASLLHKTLSWCPESESGSALWGHAGVQTPLILLYLEYHPHPYNGRNYHLPVCVLACREVRRGNRGQAAFLKVYYLEIFHFALLTSYQSDYISTPSHKSNWEMMSIAHYSMSRQNLESQSLKQFGRQLWIYFRRCMHQLSTAV